MQPVSYADRFRVIAELYDLGVTMKRQSLKRKYPDSSSDEIETRLRSWLRERPGAEHGDAVGRQVAWPRR